MNATVLQLQQLAKQRSLPHAFIFTGAAPDLIATAETFAHWLLCGDFTVAKNCNNCQICQLLAVGTCPDFLKVEPVVAGNSRVIKVEQIRELGQFVQTQSQFAKLKVAIITEVEYLNIQAANALLRTLEEPPLNVHILLITTVPKLLLATVLSRCPIFGEQYSLINNFSKQELLQNILLGVYKVLVLQEPVIIAVIERWLQQEPAELLQYFWLLITVLIREKLQIIDNCYNLDVSQVRTISEKQKLPQLWSILDKILQVRRLLLLGQQVNIQLFLESIMISWLQGVEHGRS